MNTRHKARLNSNLFDELIVDNFAGGGGASMGIEAAMGRSVDIAVNHDRNSVDMHQLNHPHTRHLCEDVWDVDPLETTAGRPVGLAWFSPDCKHFSRAKGGKPVEKKIRGLAWIVVKWAKLVGPRVIILENVREFQDWGPLTAEMKPCKDRKGQTFGRWRKQLENLGYAVDTRVLNAADYGAPTHRRRFFLIARRDGVAIQWPEPTHGPGRKPYRTAAQCIDWTLPCPSIFLTKIEAKPLGIIRPLADKTMRRIAMGLKRYVIDNPRPFIVVKFRGECNGADIDAPLPTITSGAGSKRPAGAAHAMGVAAPFLIQHYGEAPHQDTTNNSGNLIAASLTKYHGQKGNESCARGVDEPLLTADASNRFGLVSAFLSRFYGQSVGQTPAEPAPTQSARGHTSAVTAHMLKNNHGSNGVAVEDPLHTITTGGRHGVVASHLSHMNNINDGQKACSGMDEPMRTVTAGGYHAAEVRAFLVKYFGNGGQGQTCDQPLHTVTGTDRFGLVRIDGADYQIADIGLRMLTPRELLNAQFGKYAKGYILTGTKSQQVARIGNSVCPELAEAIVRANFAGKAEVAA